MSAGQALVLSPVCGVVDMLHSFQGCVDQNLLQRPPAPVTARYL